MTQEKSRSNVLLWHAPVQGIALTLFFLAPVAAWTGIYRPELLKGFIQPWPAEWANWAAGLTAAALLALPMLWVVISRVTDIFALFLAQNALLVAGYFFLETTGAKISGMGAAIERTGSLVVLINAAGFAILLIVMWLTYWIAVVSRARLGVLPAPPAVCDAQLAWLLRGGGLVVALVLALPMGLSGTIPLLAEDAALARFEMIHSDTARALYHAGTAILPFITGGILMLIIRRPLRLLGIDGWIAGTILVIQILTSNRLPLSITFFVTLTLATLEKRWPRSVLIVAFAGFLAVFTFMTGFTSLLRGDRSRLAEGNLVRNSLSVAFLGDNLIDLRDASWVFSQWDFEPLLGETYLGGLTAMMPSGLFPLKKEWHLGITGIRLVGWNPEEHFGLRITFFGESFLNFGPAGVLALAVVVGMLFGTLLRTLHLISRKSPPCLHWSLRTVILMQMCLPLTNTSDAFTFWAMLGFLVLQWILVDFPLRSSTRSLHVPSRA
jgi:hypothetical protein